MASMALAFDILAKDRASKTFDKVGDSAEKAGKKGGSAGKLIGGGMKIAAGAVLALGSAAVVGFGKFIKDAQESQRIGRLTTAVVKSTGGAAKITAAQVGDLATAISNKTGADDEAIQSGANMLLTFTNIRNEVGKGNNVFDQATQTVTDMSAALGQDTKASAVQLGKALNDPIKGVTALGKVGVSFTASQKEQIKTLVKSGKTMDAQKVILKELGREFGGAAAASSDPLTRLSVIAGNLSEQLGGLLLPIVGKFADYVSDKVVPAVSKWADVIGPKLTGGFKKASDAVKDFYAGLTLKDDPGAPLEGFVKIGNNVKTMLTGTGDAAKKLWPPLKDVAKQLYDTYSAVGLSTWGLFKEALKYLPTVIDGLTSSLTVAAKWIKENKTLVGALVTAVTAGAAIFKVYKIGVAAVSAVTKGYAVVQGLLNVVLSANPIGLVVIAIGALVAGLIYAYKNSETFRFYVSQAFSVVKIGALTLAKVAVGAFKFLVGVWLTVVDTILSAAARAFGWVPGIGPKLQGAAREFGKFKKSANEQLNAIENNIQVQIDTEQANAALAALKHKYTDAKWNVKLAAEFGADLGTLMGSGGGKGGGSGSGGGGSLLRPVNAPAGSTWGHYKSGGVHKALDFPTPTGTPVRAPLSGMAMRAGWDTTGFGTSIRSRDSDGNYSIFGHMSRLLVGAGQSFSRGQVIGLSGNTGNSSGPHLHYERRHVLYDPSTSFNFTSALARNKGGPVWPGGAFAVGDNKDGSWNRTTELFVPNTAGNIYNQDQLGRGSSVRSDSEINRLAVAIGKQVGDAVDERIEPLSTAIGKQVDDNNSGLSERDVDRIAAALSRINLKAEISAGAIDRSMGATR